MSGTIDSFRFWQCVYMCALSNLNHSSGQTVQLGQLWYFRPIQRHSCPMDECRTHAFSKRTANSQDGLSVRVPWLLGHQSPSIKPLDWLEPLAPLESNASSWSFWGRTETIHISQVSTARFAKRPDTRATNQFGPLRGLGKSLAQGTPRWAERGKVEGLRLTMLVIAAPLRFFLPW